MGPRAALLGKWQKLLLSMEGTTVVEEPDGSYSRFGVKMPTRAEALEVTLEDFFIVSESYADWVDQEYDDLDLRERMLLWDFAYNAGPESVRHLPSDEPIIDGILGHYVRLGQRTRYQRYLAGWMIRVNAVVSLAYLARL